MQIRMLTSIVGDPTASKGETIEVDTITGNRFIAGGLAEPVSESAMVSPPENAARKRATKRKPVKRR